MFPKSISGTSNERPSSVFSPFGLFSVAAGRIDKHLLRDIIEAVIMETIDSDEGLKLRLLKAMQTE